MASRELGTVLLVGAGGFLGSALRYLIGGFVQAAAGSATLPYGTLVVNATGCLAIGFLSQLAEAQGALAPALRSFLVIGLLGGYTTFSAFGNETMNFLRDSQGIAAAANVGAHLVVALGAVWLGRLTAYLIWS